MAAKKYFLLGISGATSSGKSTLSAMLHSALPGSTRLGQDDYFVEPNDPRIQITEDGYENWDVIEALDMDKMMEDVNSWIEKQSTTNSSPSILIVEGFLIFNHRPLTKLFDKKFFIKLDKETFIERRRKRVYIPPDAPGQIEAVVWPMYLKHLAEVEDQTDIEYIDGSSDLDTMFEEILKSLCAIKDLDLTEGKPPKNGLA